MYIVDKTELFMTTKNDNKNA